MNRTEQLGAYEGVFRTVDHPGTFAGPTKKEKTGLKQPPVPLTVLLAY